MNKLNEIINQVLKKHKGGEAFFDNLDENIRKNEDIIYHFINTIVIDYIFDWTTPTLQYIVVSGEFGRILQYHKIDEFFYNKFLIKFIAVKGGLRKGAKINKKKFKFPRIENPNFLFIDDSFYSGKTRDTIAYEIVKSGGSLVKTIVLYDGSRTKDDSVLSLYRYYDNH